MTKQTQKTPVKPGKKERRINLRVTVAEYEYLRAEAAGKATITDLVHSRVFGGGMRSHDLLRAVAALHQVGMNLRALTSRPLGSELETHAFLTLTLVQRTISALAARLP